MGQSVTFTATVGGFGGGAITGTVQFKDGGVNLGSPVAVSAAGQAQYATSALTAGAHTITAVYSGNVNLGASTSGGLTQTVNSALTVTSLTPSSVGRGAVAFPVTINGSGFVPGSKSLAISGSGVTGTATYVDGTHLSGFVTVSTGASTGSRNVTVTQGSSNASCTNCLTVTGAPSISSLSPSSRGQGAVNQSITLAGSGFLSGSWTSASVLFSGTSITVNSVTRNSSTSLSINITISAEATTGSRSVTVVNTDGGRATATGAFSVNARPTISSLSPSSRGQGAASQTIIVAGTGFVSGATVAFSGSGITVNSVTRNTATQLTVRISLSGGAATGSRNVTVTNPDAGWYTLSNGFTVLN